MGPIKNRFLFSELLWNDHEEKNSVKPSKINDPIKSYSICFSHRHSKWGHSHYRNPPNRVKKKNSVKPGKPLRQPIRGARSKVRSDNGADRSGQSRRRRPTDFFLFSLSLSRHPLFSRRRHAPATLRERFSTNVTRLRRHFLFGFFFVRFVLSSFFFTFFSATRDLGTKFAAGRPNRYTMYRLPARWWMASIR